MSSAGNTRGLIEACWHVPGRESYVSLPRGIPAASLKPGGGVSLSGGSVGLPRGIPAASLKLGALAGCGARMSSLPRGIPAASLKPCRPAWRRRVRPRLPRGIPAASLKQRRAQGGGTTPFWSSAGNTRGLIEAVSCVARVSRFFTSSAGNTRGLIEAAGRPPLHPALARVFRGEYPRPH